MFAPMQGAMALSESLLGLAPLTTPLQWLGVSPVAAHNIAFLLSGPVAAVAAYQLATRLTPRRDAALIAALAFGFTPYRIGQLSHMQVLWACWMPFALAALHDYLGSGKTRSLGWFGLCWMMNGFTNGYYLAYFPVLVGLWMWWFVRRWRDAWLIAATAFVASLPWIPLLYGYKIRQNALGLSRGINEIKQFSADLSAILAGSSRAWLSSHWTLTPGPEGELYPGFVLMALVAGAFVIAIWRRSPPAPTVRFNRALIAVSILAGALAVAIIATGGSSLTLGAFTLTAHRPSRLLTIALVLTSLAFARTETARGAWRRRSTLAFYTLAAAIMFVLALGPEPVAWGRDVLYRPPYWWLMQLPGLDSVRVPARFGLLMIVALTQAGALAFARLAPARHRVTALVAVAILLEGWMPRLPVVVLPVALQVPARATAAGAATLELPVSNDFAPNTAALLNGLTHSQPMINGYGGYIPAYYHVLRLGLEDQDASVIGALQQRQPVAAYVKKSRDTFGRTRALIAAIPGAESLSADDDGEWFLLPETAPDPVELEDPELTAQSHRVGTRQDLASLMFDERILTGWHSDSPVGASDFVELNFGQPVTVTSVEISLGSWTDGFSRDLEISAVDGDTVTPVWRGSTAGMTLSSALASKALTVRIRLPTPVIAPQLRLTNVWREDNRGWSIADLRVFGLVARNPG